MGALYKGFMPVWLRLAPWQIIFWTSYEQLRKLPNALKDNPFKLLVTIYCILFLVKDLLSLSTNKLSSMIVFDNGNLEILGQKELTLNIKMNLESLVKN